MKPLILSLQKGFMDNALEHLSIRHASSHRDVRYNSGFHVVSELPVLMVVLEPSCPSFQEAGFCVKSPLYVERYSGTEIRRRMIEGEKWEHLVPTPVAEVIKSFDGVSRLKNVSTSDSNFSL